MCRFLILNLVILAALTVKIFSGIRHKVANLAHGPCILWLRGKKILSCWSLDKILRGIWRRVANFGEISPKSSGFPTGPYEDHITQKWSAKKVVVLVVLKWSWCTQNFGFVEYPWYKKRMNWTWHPTQFCFTTNLASLDLTKILCSETSASIHCQYTAFHAQTHL